MMNRITGATVVLLLGLVAAVSTLLILDKDPTLLISFINTVILVYLHGEVQSIKQQTNGTTTQLMSIVDKVTPQGPAQAHTETPPSNLGSKG